MARRLYLDNFRGFSNTFIPLLDVNFLVGENSTGKTSVLSVARLFSSSEFWFNQDFAHEDIGLSQFSDMASVHSADPTFFRLGLIEELSQRGSDSSQVTAHLLTFREHLGAPALASYSHIKQNRETTIRIYDDRILFKVRIHNYKGLSEVETKLFPKLIAKHDGEVKGYRKLEGHFRSFGNSSTAFPIPVMMHIISAQIASKTSKEREPWIFSEPPMRGELVWIAPIRTKPKRTYDQFLARFSPEGDHTPYLIRRLLDSEKEAKRVEEFFKKIGEASGLFQDVKVKSFSKGPTSPFELDIVMDGKHLHTTNVGYGVSQSLPVFVEVLARPKNSSFIIQQPEVHLHPRAQAALGDFLFEMAATEKKSFMVETHSDFAIDRFRVNYRKKGPKPQSQILFFERRNCCNTVTQVRILDSGDLDPNQPETYREFFLNEQFGTLGL